jgi:hypothetical protein
MSGLNDFSVDAQRRMFVEQQERERLISEEKKALRRAGRARAGGGAAARPDDDDDYSVDEDDDDRSVGSEESFYVGIERADYSQPDSADIYGRAYDGPGDKTKVEDRLGIARVGGIGGVVVVSDWDADVIPIHDEGGGSSLHEFMNGVAGGGGGGGKGGRNPIVAVPHVDPKLGWKERGVAVDDDAGGVDQVYQHDAAEGKAFIETIIAGAPTTGVVPVLSPMEIYSPGNVAVVGAEDNAVRQMRERELRKEASADAEKRMTELRDAIAAFAGAKGKVDAKELMKKLDEMVKV